MPLILKNKSDLVAFHFGSRSALRSANELIDQLQAQVRAAHAQDRFNMAQKDQKILGLVRQIAELRYELARRDTLDAFAAVSGPSSGMVH